MAARVRIRPLRGERGLTTLELVVLSVVLGVFAAITIPAYLTYRDRSDSGHAREGLRAIVPAIEDYREEHGTYTGMTLARLRTFDRRLDVSRYELSRVTAAGYCLDSDGWRKGGPFAAIERGGC